MDGSVQNIVVMPAGDHFCVWVGSGVGYDDEELGLWQMTPFHTLPEAEAFAATLIRKTEVDSANGDGASTTTRLAGLAA